MRADLPEKRNKGKREWVGGGGGCVKKRERNKEIKTKRGLGRNKRYKKNESEGRAQKGKKSNGRHIDRQEDRMNVCVCVLEREKDSKDIERKEPIRRAKK